MAKIILNMGTTTGHNLTVISEEETMKRSIVEIKEAIKAFSRTPVEDDELYRIIKIEK